MHTVVENYCNRSPIVAVCALDILEARKTREWKTWHRMTWVENAGVDNIGVFELFRVSSRN